MEQQLLLRLPDEALEKAYQGIDDKSLTCTLLATDEAGREIQLTMGDKTYDATLVDLPCVIETQKTFNSENFYKSGDISQMLVARPVGDPLSSAVAMTTTSTSGNSYNADSGITPPSHGIRSGWELRDVGVCTCPGQIGKDTCDVCDSIPKESVESVVKQITDRIQGFSTESWELMEEEVDPAGDGDWEEEITTSDIIASKSPSPKSRSRASSNKSSAKSSARGTPQRISSPSHFRNIDTSQRPSQPTSPWAARTHSPRTQVRFPAPVALQTRPITGNLLPHQPRRPSATQTQTSSGPSPERKKLLQAAELRNKIAMYEEQYRATVHHMRKIRLQKEIANAKKEIRRLGFEP